MEMTIDLAVDMIMDILSGEPVTFEFTELESVTGETLDRVLDRIG